PSRVTPRGPLHHWLPPPWRGGSTAPPSPPAAPGDPWPVRGPANRARQSATGAGDRGRLDSVMIGGAGLGSKEALAPWAAWRAAGSPSGGAPGKADAQVNTLAGFDGPTGADGRGLAACAPSSEADEASP